LMFLSPISLATFTKKLLNITLSEQFQHSIEKL
jgi:hypothetical protein